MIPLPQLQAGDPQWLFRAATLTQPPQWVYQLGLTWVGVYPVPIVAETMRLTALVAPPDVTLMSQPLVLPDAWVPRVIETTAGFLMLSSEKTYQQGMTHVARGLALSMLAKAA
jgi:hypothetical protein